MPRCESSAGVAKIRSNEQRKVCYRLSTVDFYRIISFAVYLNDIYARVQVYGAFGFLAVFLVLVGVEDVGAVRELRQVEVPPFEHLHVQEREEKSESDLHFWQLKYSGT